MATGGPGGQQFDYAQLEGLWTGAGGPRRLAPVMAAIAMAESGGRSDARNPSGATGLWQILGNPFPGNALDPQVNARMAVAKYKTQGLRAWTTYTSGAYRRFLKRGVRPVDPSGGVSANIGSPYKNPLRSVAGLTPERVDMGVDYSGTGPVYALGPGVITNTRNAGWPGGNFISERLSAGPLKGRYVFVAEDITPHVRPGQRVDSSTVIGTMYNGGSGIETGFAAPPGTGDALGASQFSGANPTAYGAAYSKILAATGAPAGKLQGQQPSGGLPTWLQGALAGISEGLWGNPNPGLQAGSSAGALAGIAGTIAGWSQFFQDLDTAVIWLLNPENWVRITCGISGGIAVLAGLFAFTHVGGDLPLVGGIARPAALPVGIGLVLTGAVLLFVAFHNLGAANFSEVLGVLRDKAQAAASRQPAAAAA